MLYESLADINEYTIALLNSAVLRDTKEREREGHLRALMMHKEDVTDILDSHDIDSYLIRDVMHKEYDFELRSLQEQIKGVVGEINPQYVDQIKHAEQKLMEQGKLGIFDRLELMVVNQQKINSLEEKLSPLNDKLKVIDQQNLEEELTNAEKSKDLVIEAKTPAVDLEK